MGSVDLPEAVVAVYRVFCLLLHQEVIVLLLCMESQFQYSQCLEAPHVCEVEEGALTGLPEGAPNRDVHR